MIVELSDEALRDVGRLREWLGGKDSNAAVRAGRVLAEAFRSLRRFPNRGRPLGVGLRERPVRFGRYGYVIRYEVREDRVIVTRVFHALEDR